MIIDKQVPTTINSDDTAHYEKRFHQVHNNINSENSKSQECILFLCLFSFYGISTFVGYSMTNPFLYK